MVGEENLSHNMEAREGLFGHQSGGGFIKYNESMVALSGVVMMVGVGHS